MTGWIEPIALWLADFYLAATILLVVVAGILVVVKQPARRMAVGWGTLVSLLIVAVLCQSSSRPRLNLRRLLSNHDGKATEIETSQASLQVAPLFKERAPTDVDESEHFEPPQMSVEPLAATGSPSVASAAQEPSAAAWGELFVAGAVWSFLAGTLLMGTWLSIGVLRAFWLVRQSGMATAACVDALRVIVGPSARPPRLGVNRCLLMPVATGTLRPVILLPEQFAQSGRPQELKAVLAHEWAHIKNGDLWLLALDRIVLALLWAHPLYWWTRRRLRMDRELLADAAAAAQMGAADYAALLVEWARKVTCPGRAAVSTAIGVWERPGGLAQRVAALLNQSDRTVVRTSGRTRIGVAVAMALVGLFAAMISLRPPRAELAQAQSRPSASSQPAKATEERPGLNDVGGTCRDKDGKPLVGVQMSLYAVQEATGRQQLLRQGTTDGRGRFHFSQCLGKGIVQLSWTILDQDGAHFVVFARGQGLATGVKSLTEQGEPTDFTLTKAASLTGTVRDREGKPIARAWVHAGHFPFPKAGWLAGQSDAQGNFAITDLAEYKFTGVNGPAPPLAGILRVDHPAYGVAEVSYKRAPGRVDVVLGKAAAIEGTVIYGDTGKPAAGISVFANWIDEPYPYIATTLPYGTTDEQGRYRIESLPQGRFNLCASLVRPERVLLDSADKGLTGTTVDSFKAREGQTATALPIRLVKGGLVKGRLIQYRAGQNGVRDPVQFEKGQTVQILAFRGPSLPGLGVVADLAFVKPDGTFQMRLPPGLHYLLLPNQPKVDGTYRFPYCDMGEPCTEEDEESPRMSGMHRVKIREGETTEIEISVYRPPVTQKKLDNKTTQNDKPISS